MFSFIFKVQQAQHSATSGATGRGEQLLVKIRSLTDSSRPVYKVAKVRWNWAEASNHEEAEMPGYARPSKVVPRHSTLVLFLYSQAKV